MTYEHEEHHYDRVPVAPYYGENIYLDGNPHDETIDAPAVKVSVSDDDGNQTDIRLNAITLRNLRLALQRAERWMAKLEKEH